MRIGPDDRLVAAFAPFALYGPALGIAAVVPDMDVTRPATLTAAALAEAVRAIDATVIFASPAALRNVAETAGRARPPSSARRWPACGPCCRPGAPVPVSLLRRVQALVPNAELHTPYGMTEALPGDRRLAGPDRGRRDRERGMRRPAGAGRRRSGSPRSTRSGRADGP